MTVAMDGEVVDGPGEMCRSGGGEEAEVEEREGAPGVTSEQARLGGGRGLAGGGVVEEDQSTELFFF